MDGGVALARPALHLKAGDWVVVRSKAEILATLDRRGRLDKLPFQPEMFEYCGKRLRVWKVAHKTCDTINKTGGRRMMDAVHLEGVRCSGAAHAGCQALCLIFWKEAWLRRDGDEAASVAGSLGCTEQDVKDAVTHPPAGMSGDDPVWVCQTTALFEATSPLKWWDLRQYVRDVTSGNHTVGAVLRRLAFGGFRAVLNVGVGYTLLMRLYNAFQRLRGARPYPMADGVIPAGQPTPTGFLNLQAGEMVEVRSLDEIRATLSTRGFNRGMWFDQEMVKYCGGRYEVELRVERLIDERSGKMIPMKNPCIQLKDVYCRGECTMMRLGCPRAINSYWREIWLKRV